MKKHGIFEKDVFLKNGEFLKNTEFLKKHGIFEKDVFLKNGEFLKNTEFFEKHGIFEKNTEFLKKTQVRTFFKSASFFKKYVLF